MTALLHCSGKDESLHVCSAEEHSPDGVHPKAGLADPEPTTQVGEAACWGIVSWRKKGKCKKLIVTFEQSPSEAFPMGKSSLGREDMEYNNPDVDAHSVLWH